MQRLNYKVLQAPWFVLTDDFCFAFSLRTLYRNHPGMDKMVSLTGIHPDVQMFVEAPRGFVTDLASIPDALKPLLHPDGPWAAAACIHDLMYQKKPSIGVYPDTPAGNLSRAVDKDFADLMFLRIMEASGVDEFIRNSFYEAVHRFGWPSYTDDNSSVVYKVPVDQTLNYNRNYLFFREQLEPAIPDHERLNLLDKKNVNVTYLNIKRPFIALSLV
ncbi:hypothetical protein pEaSNUABM6_00170 [Erwinia phage pEa_SNUABM_6]|nr:hypothetical protein pEaSNUABM6_00170 [Erwinia phage pEa_SNUABM_6]